MSAAAPHRGRDGAGGRTGPGSQPRAKFLSNPPPQAPVPPTSLPPRSEPPEPQLPRRGRDMRPPPHPISRRGKAGSTACPPTHRPLTAGLASRFPAAPRLVLATRPGARPQRSPQHHQLPVLDGLLVRRAVLLLAGGKHGGRHEVHPGPPLQSHPPPGSRSRAGSALRPAPNPALSRRPPDNGHYTRGGGDGGGAPRGTYQVAAAGGGRSKADPPLTPAPPLPFTACGGGAQRRPAPFFAPCSPPSPPASGTASLCYVNIE